MRSTTLALIFYTLLFLVFSCKTSTSEVTPIYKDRSYTFKERATHLVSLLTLDQKVAQLNYNAPAIDHLEIPAYNWWNECLHGVARAGKATVFPQAIGMAAMFDKQQMFKVATAISDEARAKHHEFASRGKRGIYQGLTYWTPNINIFRDPRWGRGMETYGEDPFLTGELAVPFIKGLQGDDPTYLKLVATAKHFVVHSGPEADRHSFDVSPSIPDFINTYAPHFEKVVKEAKVYSVMCAYNRYKGTPCCGNLELSSLLRDDWGFKGYIVSDCWAITDFFSEGAHGTTKTVEEASAMAVKAGTDLNCGDSYPALVKAVEKGLITEKELDVSLERLFTARFKLGLFAPKGAVKYANIPYDIVDSEQHRLLALETARKSMVLLKNDAQLLPLDPSKIKTLAVIGPNANDLEVLLGNYNGYPSQPVLPLEGIKNKLPKATVNYALGCKLAGELPVFETMPSSVLFTDASKTVSGLKAEYFDNTDFKGSPKHRQTDTIVDFIWGTKQPFEDLAYDSYSVRWSGVISVPKTGNYALGGEAFNMTLFFKDSILLEHKTEHHPKKMYKYVHLEAGKTYPIRFDAVQDNTEYSMMRLLWEAPKNNLVAEALEMSKDADAILFFGGISPLLEGEEMEVAVDGFSGGDRVHTKLPKPQTDLLKQLKTLGKPIVLVLLNGSSLAINWENEHLPAILEAWYPGQAGGTAIADVIFGDYNPSGRLPLTFYKDIKAISAFKEYRMTGKTYRYFKGDPLYDFGYGLSYASFEYSNLSVPDQIKAGEPLQITATVKNTSAIKGEEVVQAYAINTAASEDNPWKSLIGFKRISLKPQEEQSVTFTIKPEQLSLVNNDMLQVVQPGEITIAIGGAQPNQARVKAKTVVSKPMRINGPLAVLK